MRELVKTKEPAKEDVTQPVATAEPETVKEEPRPSAGLASAVAASKTVKSNVTKKLKPNHKNTKTKFAKTNVLIINNKCTDYIINKCVDYLSLL